MKVSPYDTKPCSLYQLSSIDKAIKLAFIEGGIYPVMTPKGHTSGVYMVSPDNKEVPSFAHPYIHKTDGHDYVIIDSRGNVRVNHEGPYKVINHMEYNFSVLRGVFTRYALSNGMEDLANLGDIATTTFARFLGENITRRLAFSPEEQMVITMVAAFYYMCLSREAGEIDERELQRMVTKISRCTQLNAQWIYDHCGEIRHMDNIQDFVDVLKAVVPNKRMDNMNIPLLYAIVGGGWFGMNSKEIIAVAMEHLPTWLAIVATAISDRSFRKAGVSQVVLQSDRNGSGKTFAMNVVRLIEVNVDA